MASTISNILIVDPDPTARDTVELSLLRLGLDTKAVSNYSEAIKALSSETHLCLTEMQLPDASGLDIIHHIKQQALAIPVAIISEQTQVSSIVTAIKAGAIDYTGKPFKLDWLRNLLKQQSTPSNIAQPPLTSSPATGESRILGDSEAMQLLKRSINKLARSHAPVYIQGESGTGKELVAHEIHHVGTRKNAPFIPVNCGAIPENLMESEFFGHKKGSFTGANTDKQGLFQAANGGTLFLDEVADLPLSMQVKLLRAIQEGAVKAVGDLSEQAVDVRILSATHKALDNEVATGRFRQDLYYRLNVIQLDIPPLRERLGDVDTLINFFLQKIADRWQLPLSQLTRSAREKLHNYDFPGNVRELENILERAATLCDDDVISENDLQLRGIKALSLDSVSEATIPASKQTSSSETAETTDALPHDVWNPEDADAERDLVKRALDYTRWNRTRAAKILGMTFRQLSYRIQKYQLEQDND